MSRIIRLPGSSIDTSRCVAENGSMESAREDDLERRKFVGSGNDGFRCHVCGLEVLPLQNGSFRSHCPACLWSRHVDEAPGDRASSCKGLMRPVALEGSASGGWSLIHVCEECGARRRNRTAEDDPRQPDAWDRLMEISASP